MWFVVVEVVAAAVAPLCSPVATNLVVAKAFDSAAAAAAVLARKAVAPRLAKEKLEKPLRVAAVEAGKAGTPSLGT